MNPQEREKQPNMDLPPVEDEQELQHVVKALGSERNPELLSTNNGDDSILQQAQAGATKSTSTTHMQSSGNSDSSQISSKAPAIADDVDLIEKEWVEKAKEIVEKTRDNPYLQNKAISEFKADYIKKRYNKELVKSDES